MCGIVYVYTHVLPQFDMRVSASQSKLRYGKKVLRTFDVDAKGEFLENFFQPTTPSDAA
jgi:hypothetical protein